MIQSNINSVENSARLIRSKIELIIINHTLDILNKRDSIIHNFFGFIEFEIEKIFVVTFYP